MSERFDLAQHDLDIRRQIIAPHWRAFLSSPWFGYGLGSFTTVNQMLMTEAGLRELHNVRAVHNLYVQWLEEAGIVGAGLLAALFVERLVPIARAALIALVLSSGVLSSGVSRRGASPWVLPRPIPGREVELAGGAGLGSRESCVRA